MRFDVFTLLPEVMVEYLKSSILGRAQAAALINVHLHNIRDFATDRHRMTDDVPYGGGGGMIMKPEPIFSAVETVLGEVRGSAAIILLTPQGRQFDQVLAREYSQHERVALICGRYEGVDERIRMHLATEEISVGDYVLTGGELPALIFIDAVTRLLPGVLGDESATTKDSLADGLLEHAHYTRPADYRGWEVPDVLRNGDHAEIARWRYEESLRRTIKRRPDLIQAMGLQGEQGELIKRIAEEEGITVDGDSS
jgi:tRNA (guanine37-N1)-methyltransferase